MRPSTRLDSFGLAIRWGVKHSDSSDLQFLELEDGSKGAKVSNWIRLSKSCKRGSTTMNCDFDFNWYRNIRTIYAITKYKPDLLSARLTVAIAFTYIP